MTPKTLTTISALRTGDRFYFPNDKKRMAWELIELPNSTNALINQPFNNKYFFTQHQPKPQKTEVVFLRHTAESINQTDELTGII